jgi:threonine dehydratase
VEAEASTAFTASLAAGRITTIAPGTTLADGLSGNLEAGAITFALVQHVVDGVVTVSEAALVAAIRAMAAEEHLIVEGSSAVAVAAVAGGDIATAMRDIPREAPLVVVVTGANIDLDTFLAAMGGPGPLEPTVT